MYANRLMLKLESLSNDTLPISALTGTYIIGIVNAIGAFACILVIWNVGRRKIFVGGQLSMGITICLAGICLLFEWYMVTFALLCIFVICFQMSQGCVIWVYVSEVTVDQASGFVVFGQFINLTIIALTYEFMIDSELFQLHGTFIYFGVICLVGFLFCVAFVKETRGLTDL